MNRYILISGEQIIQIPIRQTVADSYSGTRFTLSRDELLTLPEFVLLSLFPNGLLPEGSHTDAYQEAEAYPVDVRP